VATVGESSQGYILGGLSIKTWFKQCLSVVCDKKIGLFDFTFDHFMG
jgi:hypothetical protein